MPPNTRGAAAVRPRRAWIAFFRVCNHNHRSVHDFVVTNGWAPARFAGTIELTSHFVAGGAEAAVLDRRRLERLRRRRARSTRCEQPRSQFESSRGSAHGEETPAADPAFVSVGAC